MLMKLLAKRRQLTVLLGVLVLIVVFISAILLWNRHQAQKKSQNNADDGQQVFAQEQKYQSEKNAAYDKQYIQTEGIVTVADFEKRFKASEREQFVMLVLQRLMADKKYTNALDFVNYAETHYAKVAQTIDFEIQAYVVAKALNKPDVQAMYKQKAEATLRAQGVIDKDQSLPESVFTGEGQSE